MRKEKSWTRLQYETAYRGFRRLKPEHVIYNMWGIENEVIQAADYSYQAYGHPMALWTNSYLEKRFWEIKWRVYASRGEIPF